MNNMCNNIVNNFLPNACLILTTNSINSTKQFPINLSNKLSAAGTGASCNYFSPGNLPAGSINLPHNPMNAILPNGKGISSQVTILVPEPKELPGAARAANVFEYLTEGSLTSIGQYCDNKCAAIFGKTKPTCATTIK